MKILVLIKYLFFFSSLFIYFSFPEIAFLKNELKQRKKLCKQLAKRKYL